MLENNVVLIFLNRKLNELSSSCAFIISPKSQRFGNQHFFFTVFARCLNTFCKTWVIVSKLNTQANKTQHWEIYHSHLCQIETLLSNLTILCQNLDNGKKYLIGFRKFTTSNCFWLVNQFRTGTGPVRWKLQTFSIA